jgi:hypothetical protein
MGHRLLMQLRAVHAGGLADNISYTIRPFALALVCVWSINVWGRFSPVITTSIPSWILADRDEGGGTWLALHSRDPRIREIFSVAFPLPNTP